MKFYIIKTRKYIRKSVLIILTPIIYIVKYIADEIIYYNPRDKLENILINRAISDSAMYIEQNISEALIFSNRQSLWNYALNRISLDGIYAEFGVFSGESINYFSSKINDKTFYGFDSFEGLKEDWVGTSFHKSFFNLNGKAPKVNKNVILIKGWFNDSLPKFLYSNTKYFAFVHLDSDTFESTSLVLNLIKDRITKNTILIFDEYHGFPNWRNGEFLSWQNFVTENNINYKYIAFSEKQTAIIIL